MSDRIKLFVDDVRPAPEGWVLCRTITEAVRQLFHGIVEEISLDYDIAHETGGTPGAFCKCPENYSAVAYFLAVMPHEMRPSKVTVHSANPGGAEKIQNILSFGKIEAKRIPVPHPHGDYVGPNLDGEDW